jgi:SNF2 family DNA or RNA helicase
VVSVYRLLTTGSIDESIWAVQEEKVALHNGVLQEGALAVGGDDDGDEKPGAEVKDLLQRYFAAF